MIIGEEGPEFGDPHFIGPLQEGEDDIEEGPI